LVLAMMLVAALPHPALAQSPDFLFGTPRGTFGIQTGWLFARADSQIFEDIQEQFTIERKDFNAPALGFDLDLTVTPRTSAVIGFEFSRASKKSEYRDFVDNDRLPINQTTRLRQMNLTGSIKFAVTPRGREISSHAWIPSAVTPYVGAGGGALHYEFVQEGDFINFRNFDVLPDTLGSRGWTPSGHVFGGVDIKASKRVYLNGEARYVWSHADLDPLVFRDFDPIDLTGMKLTGGIRFMF
jgi:hypothetical protein